MQDQFFDEGQLQTKNARKYMQQLCKHFAHKVEVDCDETTAKVAFPFGPATMTATDDALSVVITADSSEGILRGRGAIDSHLETYAFRESFTTMDWAALRKAS